MRKILLLVLAFIMTIGAVGANAEALYKTETVENIAPGITLTRVKAFYSGYDLTYSYITADLTDADTQLTLLKSDKGINERETVLNLAKTEENVVAAINADFFSMTADSFSQGIEYKNGRLLQSPIDTAAFAGGFLYGDELVLSNIDFHIMVVAPNLEYKEVYRLNKPMSMYGALLMYTSDYNGGYSPAPGDGVVEMIVEDGCVVGFNRTKEPVKIPENGYVLEISEMDSFLTANFKEGDEVKIEQYITPTLENLTMAFGGGSLLLKNGKTVTFTNNVSGNNPRSAVGTDSSGSKLYLMAVDGRQSDSRGVSQTELAALMAEIGCSEAMNLDGGGSTNMVSEVWGADEVGVVNRPTENRKVINALGLKSSAEGDYNVHEVKLTADKTKVYSGEEVALELQAADNVYTMVEIDPSTAEFNSEYVVDNTFKAEKGGVYELYADVEGVRSNSVSITVVDEIAGIDVACMFELEKTGDSEILEIFVYDEYGNYVLAPKDEFEISIFGDAAEYSDGTIIAKKAGVATLEVKKDGLTSYSKIKVATDDSGLSNPEEAVADSANKKISDADKTFVYAALDETEKNLFDRLYAIRLAKILGSFNQSAVLGNQVHPALDNIYAVNYDKYMALEKDGALFISLPTKNGSVRSADSSALAKLKEDLAVSKTENVFITTDGYFSMSGTEFETIKSLVSKSGKMAYVISRGSENGVKIIDGIRFFTVADNREYPDLTDGAKNLKMLRFDVSDGAVYYSFENIFDI